MSDNILYYVDTHQGCGIRAAKNIEQAIKECLKESGSYNYISTRQATHADVDWVKAMSGSVPSGRILGKGESQ
jgi:hypothetical protein